MVPFSKNGEGGIRLEAIIAIRRDSMRPKCSALIAMESGAVCFIMKMLEASS